MQDPRQQDLRGAAQPAQGNQALHRHSSVLGRGGFLQGGDLGQTTAGPLERVLDPAPDAGRNVDGTVNLGVVSKVSLRRTVKGGDLV